MRKLFFGFGLLTALTSVSHSWSSTLDYRLGVVIVVDQFRADYLMRFKSDFEKPRADSGGYRFLIEKGAYIPLADHGLFQNMTCPGHAAMMTGSYPYRNHISLNTWFDRESGKPQYCVQDDAAKLIGSEGVISTAKMGISPKNLNADTLGDELKNVDRPSRVVSIAAKDRAAVMLGGKRSDYSLWIDPQSCEWASSQYYAKELPAFAKKANEHMRSNKTQPYSWESFKNILPCSSESMRTPWTIQETLDLALRSVDDLKLGRGKDTDLLLLSFSAHDYLGHSVGPNDPLMKQMTLAEDRKISAFLKELSHRLPNGLKDVFIVLTGDHGIPPAPSALPQDRIQSANLNEEGIHQMAEAALIESFGKPKGGKWIQAIVELQLYLNPVALQEAKITQAQVLEVLRKRLMKEGFLDDLWTRDSILRDRKVPPGEYGKTLDRSLNDRNGDIVMAPKPFYFSDSGAKVSHMTMYSYDRYVPLIFWGRTFKPGEYRQNISIVDIAPTLASVLHVLPPTQSEGRVITEILR